MYFWVSVLVWLSCSTLPVQNQVPRLVKVHKNYTHFPLKMELVPGQFECHLRNRKSFCTGKLYKRQHKTEADGKSFAFNSDSSFVRRNWSEILNRFSNSGFEFRRILTFVIQHATYDLLRSRTFQHPNLRWFIGFENWRSKATSNDSAVTLTCWPANLLVFPWSITSIGALNSVPFCSTSIPNLYTTSQYKNIRFALSKLENDYVSGLQCHFDPCKVRDQLVWRMLG